MMQNKRSVPRGRARSILASKIWAASLGTLVVVILLTSCSTGTHSSAPPTSAPATPRTSVTPTTVPKLTPPPVPAVGAYLGAWVDPNPVLSTGKNDFVFEMRDLPSLQRALKRRLPIVHVYSVWTARAPVADLSKVSTNGSIPILDWACGIPDATVAAGGADSTITAYAEALKAYGKPVFLRWYWEMNLLATRKNCQSAGGAVDYVAAWQHIWTIFQNVGASNVAFVWCPGVAGPNPMPYYPGNAYVDWIGIDGYDSQGLGTSAFSDLFSGFYQTWSIESKPMMVAETGAMAADQAAYLSGVQAALPTFPLFKAFIYWDAVGKKGSWTLAGSGLAAFHAMAHSRYFLVNGPGSTKS